MRSDSRPGDRPVRLLAVFAAAVIAAHLLDPVAFRYVRVDNVYGEDWGRMLRVMGFLPLWIVAGAALMMHERTPPRRIFHSRGGLIIAGATLGGLAAELGKLAVRRLRPGELGEYVFRSYTERPFSTGGLGMPSSHAGVAFGAAAVLSRIFPRARVIWWGLAWGCGLTRVAAGAHFLSDIVVAALIGWIGAALLWHARGAPLQPAASPLQPTA